MRDLTDGPIPGHLLQMALPIAIGVLAPVLLHRVMRARLDTH